ncbi:MAG: hypothetical protein CMF17_11475 [Idiomarinaceae bacterium]|nr:hypothetical protein [Idiomarinaceae bacterium]
MKANHRHWCIALLLASASASSQEPADNTDPMSRIHLGEAVYALYESDPFNALTQIAVSQQRVLEPEDSRQLNLIHGGVSLGWGMPGDAQQALQKVLSDPQTDLKTRIRARYWLSRLYFSQAYDGKAREHYREIADYAASDARGDTDYLTESQWDQLHYMAANIDILAGQESEFDDKLSATDIETYYLLYNRGVQAFSGENYREAETLFAKAQQGLVENLAPVDAPKESWLSWLGVKSDPMPQQVDEQEFQALLNQILLARGQTLLAEGKLAPATDAFGQITGQTLARDEALLGYGWALAQGDDWPMAMGIWQFLTKQPENLYTLQARHALGLGYARHKGYQDALMHFETLDTALSEAVAELDVLKSQISDSDYWAAIGKALSESDDVESVPEAYAAWPLVHRDILKRIVTTDAEQSSYSLLQHLRTLSDMVRVLRDKEKAVGQYATLIKERRIEHARRVRAIDTASHDETLNAITKQANELGQRLNRAMEMAEAPTSDTAYFDAIAALAKPSQQSTMARLNDAQQRLDRLLANRDLKPGYAMRLQRLKGIIQWQIDDQFVPLAWQYKNQLASLQALREEAAIRLRALNDLVENPMIFDAQETRVQRATEQVARRQQETNRLINVVTQTLIARTEEALETRREYLLDQQTTTRLALLQLRDRWQPDAQGGE